MSQGDSRVWVEVEQRLFYRVDVTDWIDEEPPTQELARSVLEYHNCQLGPEVECIGYGWGS